MTYLRSLCLLLAALPLAAQPQDLRDPDLSVMQRLQSEYGWGAAFGWPAGTNPCPRVGANWTSVACSNGRVDAMTVNCGAVKLNQEIPPILAQLTALRDLSIEGCNLYGRIPEILGTMTRLTGLRLEYNSLSGPVPVSVQQLPNLLLLGLRGNRLTGTISLPNSCSRQVRARGNFFSAVPENWVESVRDVRYNCIANLPASCAANTCVNAPPGNNECSPQRSLCPSELRVTLVAGDGQRTQINTAFPSPLQVRVTNAEGVAQTGVPVRFAGRGINTANAMTDASGLASAIVAANGVTGGNTVTASAGSASITFGLTAGLESACSRQVVVTSNAESGAGTLRQALTEVCAGGVIDLSGIAGQTVSLPLNGRLYLSGDFTVEGRGVTIHGNGRTRLFFMQAGHVRLRNLTLTGGLGQPGGTQHGGPGAGMGGAIFQNGGSLTLDGVVLTGNVAQGGSPDLSGLADGGGFGAGSDPGDLGGPFDGAGGTADGIGAPGGFGAGGGAGTLNVDGDQTRTGRTIGGPGGFGAAGGGATGANANGMPHGSENNSTNGGWGAGQTGGAGLGGAIFVRSGQLNLAGVTLANNSAIGGTTAQGKGGALFLYEGALLNHRPGITFSNNAAAQAGVPGFMYSDDTYRPGATCPGVDTVDICGRTPAQSIGVTVAGPGSVNDSTTLLACSTGTCTALFQSSTTLTATPTPGYRFSGWSGGCSGTGTCTLAPGGTATATFGDAAPEITQDPSAVTANALQPVSFTAAAIGGPAPTVQWQVSVNNSAFTDILNATQTTLSFVANGSQNGNRYRAVFTNSAGSVPTSAALLTVNQLTPVLTWPAPSPIVFGSALGAAQLRATANIGGTFVYTPAAGTVLTPGSHTLRTTFTPADSVNYGTATGSVSLTVTGGSGATPHLVITTQLSRQGNEIVAVVTLANTGGTAATNVTIHRAAIGATLALTPAPLVLADIPANSVGQTTVRFPATVGAPGATVVLSISGTQSGRTFSSGSRMVLP